AVGTLLVGPPAQQRFVDHARGRTARPDRVHRYEVVGDEQLELAPALGRTARGWARPGGWRRGRAGRGGGRRLRRRGGRAGGGRGRGRGRRRGGRLRGRGRRHGRRRDRRLRRLDRRGRR